MIVFQVPVKHVYGGVGHFLIHNVCRRVARKILRVAGATIEGKARIVTVRIFPNDLYSSGKRPEMWRNVVTALTILIPAGQMLAAAAPGRR